MFGPFAEKDLDALLHSATLNSLALTAMCHVSIPYIKRGGSIVNMGSNSSWQPVPYQAVYGASKSYVLSLSRAIGRELRPRGIRVMCVCPGWIKTEFQEHAQHDEYIRYVDRWYGPDEVAAQAMADLAVFRAGATGLAELTARGIPAILVPYPYAAENHQEHNARACEEAGAARMILDRELTPERLSSVLTELLSEPDKLQAMAKASRAMGRPQAASDIADLVLDIAKK